MGHKVYIHNDTRIFNEVYDYLTEKYNDRVKFVDNKDNITEPIFIVNL